MNVKVDYETMTLKIVDCDILEGSILELTHNKTIEVLLIDSSTSEDHANDIFIAEKESTEDLANSIVLNVGEVAPVETK